MSNAGLKSYKNLLRAAQQTFKNDPRVLNAAILKIRSEFKANKLSENRQELIDLANTTAQMLRRNVVQATEKENNKGVYVINITKDTELLDNDTIKKQKQSNNKCCQE